MRYQFLEREEITVDKTGSISIVLRESQDALRSRKGFLRKPGITIDEILFFAVLSLLNLHLLSGVVSDALIFFPSLVVAGEWWRFLSHPFVHVTWYHLFLDAGAFFLLYSELRDRHIAAKLFYIVTCGTFSLLATVVAAPLVYTNGLCGLSGIAHGLMAVSGLDLMRQKKNARLGLITFAVVVSKSIYETISGHVLFEFMHLGLCGFPIAASHAGGVLGGIVAFSAMEGCTRAQKKAPGVAIQI